MIGSLQGILLRPGQQADAAWSSRLVRALLERTVLKGVGVRLRHTPSGVIVTGSARDGSAAASAQHGWQPFLSPTATGDAADRTIRIRVCTVNGTPPSTPNIEIVVPANCTDGYFVWLEASVNTDGTMASFDYGHGTALPAAPALPDDGSPPPLVYDCIFVVTSTDTSVTLPAYSQLRWAPLTLEPVETNRTATFVERRMKFDGPGGISDIPA